MVCPIMQHVAHWQPLAVSAVVSFARRQELTVPSAAHIYVTWTDMEQEYMRKLKLYLIYV